MLEMGTPYGVNEIRDGLKRREPIKYSDNGYRSISARKVLKKVEPVLGKVGITRIAEISQLAFYDFPVFQATRPNIFGHIYQGQNTGSQGKGSIADQAKISAIMEAIEGYCAEPKLIKFVRGSFDQLRIHHCILNPKTYRHALNARPVRSDEPLMWMPAYSVEHDVGVLVPAETVCFPFFAKDFSTRAIYPSNTNGLASGSTYLEAVNHGLYEVIEREYIHAWQIGDADVEFVYEDEFKLAALKKFREVSGGEFEVKIFAVTKKGVPNLPMLMCYLDSYDKGYKGMGCHANLDIALTRAFSEALQTMATRFSATRENAESEKNVYRTSRGKKLRKYLPGARTLKRFDKKVQSRRFRDLRDEYRFLVKWLHQAGYKNIFVANLTRIGIDIPVVRVLVPGMSTQFEFTEYANEWSTRFIIKHQYSLPR